MPPLPPDDKEGRESAASPEVAPTPLLWRQNEGRPFDPPADRAIGLDAEFRDRSLVAAPTSLLWRQEEGDADDLQGRIIDLADAESQPARVTSSTSLLWRQDEGGADDIPEQPTGMEAQSKIWDDNIGLEPLPSLATEQRTSLRSYAVMALAIFVALLLLDGVYVGVRLKQSLNSAGVALQRAEAALTRGDVSTAGKSLARADASSDLARSLTLHPSFVLASWVPGLDHDIRSARALSDAARLSTDAGDQLLQAVKTLGIPGGNISRSLYRNGQVQFDTIDRAAPRLSAAVHLLTVARRQLLLDRPKFAPMRRVVDGTRLTLTRVLAPATRASTVIARVPSMLGRGTQRRYLLAFQALGEARATGGVIGLYGVLTARRRPHRANQSRLSGEPDQGSPT